MTELDDIKARIESDMANHDEPMMHSACWEYACPCHFDLPRAIEIAEERQQAFNLLADERLRINDAEVVRDLDQARASLYEVVEQRNTALADIERFRRGWSDVEQGCLVVRHGDFCEGCKLLDWFIGEDR